MSRQGKAVPIGVEQLNLFDRRDSSYDKSNAYKTHRRCASEDYPYQGDPGREFRKKPRVDLNRHSRENTPVSGAEESDLYKSVVLEIDQSCRVIECHAGLQWILQKQSGARGGKRRWKSISFARRKSALALLIQTKTGYIASEIPGFRSLPVRFGLVG